MTLARSPESMADAPDAEAEQRRRAIMPDTPPADAPAELVPLYEVDEAFHDLYLEIADCPSCGRGPQSAPFE